MSRLCGSPHNILIIPDEQQKESPDELLMVCVSVRVWKNSLQN